MSELKQTAMIENHRALGAKLIDFGGWEMPVQYSSLAEEHMAVRNAVGLFDVSHMGEFLVEGPKARACVDLLVTNDVGSLVPGQAQYNLFCNEDAGIVDDLIVYCLSDEKFLLVVNASNIEKDFAWVQKNALNPEIITNHSDRWSLLALQGPKAESVLSEFVDFEKLSSIKYYHFIEEEILGTKVILSRTGYTGEPGFEIYLPWEKGSALWEALMKAGVPHGIKPCGLGCRDTLRTEMKFALYGHEINDTTNPFEASLGWVVKLKKDKFLGKEKLVELKEAGKPKRKSIGFMMLDRGVPRQGYELVDPETSRVVGEVTSGTHSPVLGKGIGIGYLPIALSTIGTKVQVRVRNKDLNAQVVKTPFIEK